jgi:hypothetical protein
MAGSHPEPLHSPSELRREAARLLDAAIRSQARRTRKHLLASSFEPIQQAEMMSEPPEAPLRYVPPPYLD